jgi:hypothetical protein
LYENKAIYYVRDKKFKSRVGEQLFLIVSSITLCPILNYCFCKKFRDFPGIVVARLQYSLCQARHHNKLK